MATTLVAAENRKSAQQAKGQEKPPQERIDELDEESRTNPLPVPMEENPRFRKERVTEKG